MKNFNELYKQVEEYYLEIFPLKETMSGKLICKVEVFLYLLEEFGFIEKDISKAWTILTGYDFNEKFNLKISNDDEEVLIQKSRGFIRILGSSTAFRNSIEEYMKYSQVNKLIYRLDEQEKEIILYRNQSKGLDSRRELIRNLYLSDIKVKESSVEVFDKKVGYIRNDGVIEQIYINNRDITTGDLKIPINKNRKRGYIRVDKNELLKVAKIIDSKIEGKNYEQRVSNITFENINDNSLTLSDSITIEGLYNLVGRVGAGKSTLVEILSAKLAMEGKNVAIVVDSIKSIVELLDYFERINIKAVPIWGYGGRESHIQKAYSSVKEDDFNDIKNTCWNKWFSHTCILDGLRGASDVTRPFVIGKEPCLSILEDPKSSKKFYCPFYTSCPSHLADNSMSEANVFITTPAAFLKTRISPVVFNGDIKTSEFLYYNCDLVIFDESDRVQLNLDQGFTDYLTLVDGSDSSYLNKLALKVEDWFYKDRLRNINNKKLNKWHDVFINTQRISNILIDTLNNNKELVKKLSNKFATAYTLYDSFEKGINTEQVNHHDMQKFIENPFNDKKFIENPKGTEIIDIRMDLLSNNSIDEEINSKIRSWYFSGANVDINSIMIIKFIIALAIFERLLKQTLRGLEEIPELKQLNIDNASIMYSGVEDYLPFIPSAPTGNIFGIRVSADSDNNLKRLVIFKSKGLGRWLLTNYNNMYKRIDGNSGPNVLLLSGTSWAPNSYSYHIDTRVKGILNGPEIEAKAIEESEFYFEPVFIDNTAINVSGADLYKRKDNLKTIVSYLVKKSVRDNKSKLEKELDKLEEDRKRILLLVGSYDEARELKTYLDDILSNEGTIKKKDVCLLIKDGEEEESSEDIFRGEVTEFGLSDSKILIAPLMALERGYNILNINRRAAIGSAYFLVRPMPVPNDISIIVNKLNSSMIRDLNSKFSYDMGSHINWVKTYRDKHMQEMQTLLIKSERLGYRQLKDNEVEALCMTWFVTMCQVIGRLIRGGCKARVHFCDAKFAPNSVQNMDDTYKTSILVGIIEAVKKLIESDDPIEKEIATKLYYPFYKGLRKCEGLKYGERS